MIRTVCFLSSIIVAAASFSSALASSGSTQGSAAPSSPPDPVVARVNETEIHASQLEQVVQLSLRKGSFNTDLLSDERMATLRKNVLDHLVEEELLYQACRKEKIEVQDKKVEEEMQALESRFSSPQEYEASLRDQGFTLDMVRERVRRSLSVEELIRRETSQEGRPSEAEVTAYYQKNRDRLRRTESVHVQQVFLKLPPHVDPETKGRARQALEGLIKEIRGGKDFSAAVRQYGQDSGGDLGWLTRGGPTPILAEAALKLKTGEISDIVETPSGLHVLKVMERRPGGEATLEESRPQIENLLQQQKEKEALSELLAKLKTEAKIEIIAPVP
jgi:parvulin-like peptidyl-prolyl isomerase